MKKIVTVLVMLVGLVASCFAAPKPIKKEVDTYYDNSVGLCELYDYDETISVSFYASAYDRLINIDTCAYDELDRFLLIDNKYESYMYHDKNDESLICIISPWNDEEVLYMWFEINK